MNVNQIYRLWLMKIGILRNENININWMNFLLKRLGTPSAIVRY